MTYSKYSLWQSDNEIPNITTTNTYTYHIPNTYMHLLYP